MPRWVSFSPSKTQLPSVLLLCFLHTMTGKMFPLSVLASSLLPFALSLHPRLRLSILTLSPPLCLEACHSLILFPPHAHPCQWEMREGENYRTVCIFPELLKSALMLMADHVRRSAWAFHAHTHAHTHKFACEFKQKAFGGHNGWCVHLCVCVCQGVYRQR